MKLMRGTGNTGLSDGYVFLKAVAQNRKTKVDEYRDRLVHTFGKKVARALLEWFKEAAKYACCKSHHVAEALTAYQAAFLKYHYPDQFQQVLEEVRAEK